LGGFCCVLVVGCGLFVFCFWFAAARLVHRLEGAGEQDHGDLRETRRTADVLATS
jgi:hypothetical protein